MKLWEALKIHDETGRKIRPKGETLFGKPIKIHNGHTVNEYTWSCVDQEWEIEPAKVEVTRESLRKGFDRMVSRVGYNFEDFCKELGL
jgi:hypothetical protein